ncbi:hypothetical protein [Atopomonas sediminilitoris]|uniref:hypothetical protein n=1 Tax=Atopomonas sediminilitoris TaxID=2919919 RepID=UPI001F4EBD76|nr:hypothetical protein [Atopomonas sediminilitoris]MCJ8167757.1 hypothetical protein [Atopomonas sediminilitoris]
MKVITVVLATSLSLAPMVQAQELFSPAEVSDADLANIRGKFVLPDRIVHFGISMTTLWSASNGQQLGAQVSLNLQSNAQPVLNIQFIDQAGNGVLPAGQGQIIGGNALADVQGIAQSTRVAGSANSALNGLHLNISNAAPSNSAALPASEQRSLTNALGTVQVAIDQGGLRVALNTASQGNAWQNLGGGGLNQGVAISGQLNRVSNLTQLNVALKDAQGASPASQQAWQTLQTLRPAGY